jgi:hypothetical protein
MPVSIDPLGREWLDISANNPARVDEVRPALLSFVAFDKQQQARSLGTGVVIAGDREFSLAMTARHVLDFGLKHQQPHSLSHPTSQFKTSGATLIRIDELSLRAFWMDSSHADFVRFRFVSYNASTDLALCLIEPQTQAVDRFSPVTIPMDTTEPKVGETVQVVALNWIELSETAPPQSRDGKGQALRVNQQVSIRLGVVTGVYPSGLRSFKWHCFTTSAPVHAGMSGGFVSRLVEGRTVACCGIVSADASRSESFNDPYAAGESVIACSWPGLALPVPTSIPPDSPISLLEAMRYGMVPPPIGGLDGFVLSLQEDGDGVLSRSIPN